MKRILLLPHVQIHNANALSSAFTIGFPAMTAWLGGVHALQRQLNRLFPDLIFKSTAIISHKFDLQTFKGQGDYIFSIIGTGNPLDKSGKRTAFIEEARCHLTISLVIEYEGIDHQDEDKFIDNLKLQLQSSMKFAGGDILNFKPPQLLKIGEHKDFLKLIRKLMPGFVLIERRDLMIEAMKNGQDAMEALLAYLEIMHRSEINEKDKVAWTSMRKTSGWMIPIATGFQGISALGTVKNQRDPEILHRFAESIVTLGEFQMPYRLKNIDDMFWHSYADVKNNLYLCQQNKSINVKG